MGDADIQRVKGPPSFEAPGRVRNLEASVGDEFQSSMSLGNRGGPAEGVRVIVRGEAIDEGLVEIDSVRLMGGTASEQREAPAVKEDVSDGRVFSAEFEDVGIDGALSETVDFSEMGDAEARRVMDAHKATRLSVYARGHAAAEGEGDLTIEISAMNAPEATVGESSRVSVLPTPRMPLNAEPDTAPPHTLRQMQKPETLFGLVHFGAPAADWADEAIEAIGRWKEAISGFDDTFIRVVFDNERSRPDEEEVPGQLYDDREYLERLAEQFGGVYQHSAVLRPQTVGDETFEPAKTGGFSYFSCTGSISGATGEPAPALGFWVGMEGRSRDEAEELRAELVTIIDRLAESAPVVQAMLDEWAWAPALGIRSLPYEIVCGLASSNHLRRDWLERYLRAPTSTLWLGERLWEPLDETDFSGFAEVEPFGDTRRVRLTKTSERDRFERALAPILAGPEAWGEEAG